MDNSKFDLKDCFWAVIVGASLLSACVLVVGALYSSAGVAP